MIFYGEQPHAPRMLLEELMMTCQQFLLADEGTLLAKYPNEHLLLHNVS